MSFEARHFKRKLGLVVLLLGPRRVGKTWFLKQLLPELGMPYLFLNGDDALVRNVFQQQTLKNRYFFVSVCPNGINGP
ncbi:MAG: AAA family ATPase [Bacteroidota bacterium]